MRRWQLEYGAEIGRAVTNFDGPIVFVVVSRYHGGAFVVFSKALTESMEIAAVEGSYASVIGGARRRPRSSPEEVKAAHREGHPGRRGPRRPLRPRVRTPVRCGRPRLGSPRRSAPKLGEVADEFDSIHTIERALRVGSVDRIIAAAELRPYVIDALERGMGSSTNLPLCKDTPLERVQRCVFWKGLRWWVGSATECVGMAPRGRRRR